MADFIVRPYEARDREAVRAICCDTGWLGTPIDPFFEDREAFADFLTRYYTDEEPESSFVAEQDGHVVGYLLGCTRPDHYRKVEHRMHIGTAMRVLLKYATLRYNKRSRTFLHWMAFRASSENPTPVENAAHLHFNMLPDARVLHIALGLVDAFADLVRERGLSTIYGRMTITPGRRDARLFERFGWKVIDRREVSKYRKFVDTPIYCATIVRELDKHT